MSENHSGQDYSRYEEMTTEEMEGIFRANAMLPEDDADHVDRMLYIMEVYAQRKKNEPHKTAEDSYADFQRRYLTPNDGSPDGEPLKTSAACGQKRKFTFKPALRPVAAMAVVAVLMFYGTLTAQTMGFDHLNAVAGWTKEFFYFEDATVPESSTPALNDLEAMRDQLPGWVPEGFVLQDESVTEGSTVTLLTALYQKGESTITVMIKNKRSNGVGMFIKDTTAVEVYESHGVAFYIMKNYDRTKAMWVTDDLVCGISGDVSRAEMIRMIDSI